MGCEKGVVMTDYKAWLKERLEYMAQNFDELWDTGQIHSMLMNAWAMQPYMDVSEYYAEDDDA